MPQLTLYIDTQNKSLVAGPSSTQTVQPSSLPLYYGDTLTLFIYLLTKTQSTTRPNAFDVSTVSTAGLSLELYLNDGTVNATSLTQQTTWSTDANNTYFYADVALNTAGLLTLVTGSVDGGQCYLKIGYKQSAKPTTVYSGRVTVGVGLPAAPVVVPAGQTALSADTALSTFVHKQPENGEPIYLASPTGKVCALYFVDNPDGTASFQASQVN